MSATMEVLEFERELARLRALHEASGDNPASYGCRGCRNCSSCMFCDDCTACSRCTHCRRCVRCGSSSHSADCTDCCACAYCRNSSACLGGAYLVLCHGCTDCTYCFGCVGLVRQEFHLLNRRYAREEYFALTRQLMAALGIGPTP